MTRQTYRITVDVDEDLADKDVAGSLVYRIEHGDGVDVALVELVDPPKPKLRHRVESLERKVRDLFDIEARIDNAQRTTASAHNDVAHKVAALTGRVDKVTEQLEGESGVGASLDGLQEQLRRYIESRAEHESALGEETIARWAGFMRRLDALEEWRKHHSGIDVGAIVDDRLGPLERRFDALRGDLAESRRVGQDIVETWANHRHRTQGAEFDTDPATGLIRSRAGLTGKPEPTA